jgi:hypothetical protein
MVHCHPIVRLFVQVTFQKKGTILCCASKTIEVYQITLNATNVNQILTLKMIYNTSGDIPQDLVIYNDPIVYYIINIGEVYQLTTQKKINTSAMSLNDSSFHALYHILDIDESDQIVDLVNINETLFPLPLIICNISMTVIPSIIDTYPMLIPILELRSCLTCVIVYEFFTLDISNINDLI